MERQKQSAKWRYIKRLTAGRYATLSNLGYTEKSYVKAIVEASAKAREIKSEEEYKKKLEKARKKEEKKSTQKRRVYACNRKCR